MINKKIILYFLLILVGLVRSWDRRGNILDLVMKIPNINDFSQALAHLDDRTIPKQPDSFSFSQQDTILSGVTNVEVLPITKPALINYIQSRGINMPEKINR